MRAWSICSIFLVGNSQSRTVKQKQNVLISPLSISEWTEFSGLSKKLFWSKWTSCILVWKLIGRLLRSELVVTFGIGCVVISDRFDVKAFDLFWWVVDCYFYFLFSVLVYFFLYFLVLDTVLWFNCWSRRLGHWLCIADLQSMSHFFVFLIRQMLVHIFNNFLSEKSCENKFRKLSTKQVSETDFES